MMSPSHPLHLVLGPIIWAIWFALMYAVLSVVCQVAPPSASLGALTWLNAKLLVLTLLVTLLLLVPALRCWRASGELAAHQRFMARVSAAVYLLSAASTVAVGLPVLVLPPCL